MKKKILIIENDTDLVRMLVISFRAAGFEVGFVANGTEAMSKLCNFEPDLIILDLLLPSGSGWGILETLHIAAASRRIPVIVYSGVEEDLDKSKALGVAAYFHKPRDTQEIVDKAKELLKGT